MKSAGFVAVLLILLVPVSGLAAGKGQKGKKKDQQAGSSGVAMPLSDNQAIDLLIAQMLAAWQVGNLDMLHKSYSDDVMVVSGAWEPPLIGWERYAQAYQTQRARMQGVRMDRTNTYIKVAGNFAWATYQWVFTGESEGKSASVRGQTTLILQKQPDGRWLIVLNHTSMPPEAAAPAQVPQAPPKPSTPPAAGPGA